MIRRFNLAHKGLARWFLRRVAMISPGITRDTPVLIFSAGATKDSGGPLTNEILHEAFHAGPSLVAQQNAIQLLQQFLRENFPTHRAAPEDYRIIHRCPCC